MSNHSGSRMLNTVLKTVERASVFELLGKAKTQELIREILRTASYEYDCSSGEILEGIGERIGICYLCKESADVFKDELCEKCAGVSFSEAS